MRTPRKHLRTGPGGARRRSPRSVQCLAILAALAVLPAAPCLAQRGDRGTGRGAHEATRDEAAPAGGRGDAAEAKAPRPGGEPPGRGAPAPKTGEARPGGEQPPRGASAKGKGAPDGGGPETSAPPSAPRESSAEAPGSERRPERDDTQDRPGDAPERRPAARPKAAAPAGGDSGEVTADEAPADGPEPGSPVLPLAVGAGAGALASGSAAAEQPSGRQGAAGDAATSGSARGRAAGSETSGATDPVPRRASPEAAATRRARDTQVTRSLEELTVEEPTRPMTAADRLALIATLSRQARMQTATMKSERAGYQESLDTATRVAAELSRQKTRLPGLLVAGDLPLSYVVEARDRADRTVEEMGALFDEALQRRAELAGELADYERDVGTALAVERTWSAGDLAAAMGKAVGVLRDRAAVAGDLAALLDEVITETVRVSEAAADLSLELTAGMRTQRSRSLTAQTTKPLAPGTLPDIRREMGTLLEQATTGLVHAGDRVAGANPLLAATITAILLAGAVTLWWSLPRFAEGLTKGARDRGLAEGIARLSRVMVPGGRALLLMGFVAISARAWHLPGDWEVAAVAFIGAWLLYFILRHVLRELLAPGAPERRILHMTDEAAGNLFGLLRSAALYTVAVYPFIVLLGQVGERPVETLRALQFAYLLGLLALLVLMTRRSGGLLALLPAADTPQGSAMRRAARVVIPLAALGIGVSATAAAGGYTNLAAHISRTLSLEVVLLACAVFVDHLILRAPGVAASQWRGLLTAAFWGAIVAAQVPIFRLHTHHAAIAYDLLKTPFITVQGAEVSGLSVIKAVLLIVAAYAVARFIRTQLQTSDYLTRRMQSGAAYALANLAFYIVLTIGGLWSIVAAGFQLSVLTVFAGMAGIGLGFGLQDVVGNFVSGLILLIERPVAVGDYVEVDTLRGHITAINLRSTTIRTRDNNIVLLPNSDLAGSRVTNLTLGDPMVRVNVAVGVSYSSNMDLVQQVLRRCVEEDERFLPEPEPRIIIAGFGNSSVDWEVWASVATPEEAIRTAPDLRRRIWDAFAEHGIEIPFPQTDLHVRSSDIPLPFGGRAEADDDAAPPSA